MVDVTQLPWVVFSLNPGYFALPIDSIEEMTRLDEVAPLPASPPYVRGITTLRNHAVPVIDLRVRLGMPSAEDERKALIAMLSAREEEHRNWLSELAASVEEHRAFRLSTDPHQCAFGRWYDGFQTQNQTLQSVLRRFDAPHKAIHAIAESVAAHARDGRYDKALALIQSTRDTELATMVKLFASLRQMIQELRREVVLMARHAGRAYALAVDAVESVEPLILNDDVNGTLDAETDPVVAHIAQRTKDHRVVMVLCLEGLLATAGALPASHPLLQSAAVAV